MKEKIAVAIILMLTASLCVPAMADGLFPKSYTLFGVIMPDIRFAIGRDADKVEISNNGEKLLFNGFTAEEYELFGCYAKAEGLRLKEKTYKDGTLKAELSKFGVSIIFEYAYDSQKASLFYPINVRKELEKKIVF